MLSKASYGQVSCYSAVINFLSHFYLMPRAQEKSGNEDVYDPIEVESVIDDMYAIAEGLETYREEVEEAIGKVESLPYSVHEDGSYGEEELRESEDGFYMLETLQSMTCPASLENGKKDAEASTAIKVIEHALRNEAFDPAMEDGDIELPELEE